MLHIHRCSGVAIQQIPAPALTIFGNLIATQSQRNGTKKKVVILHLHDETTKTNMKLSTWELSRILNPTSHPNIEEWLLNVCGHPASHRMSPITNPYSATYGLCIPTWPMLD